MAILNTHALVKKFTQHGFTEEHAELIVDAINDQSDQLATKNDLVMLKTEISNLELKLDSKISNLDSKIEYEISEVKSEIKAINTNIKWIMAISLLIVGILLKNTFIH